MATGVERLFEQARLLSEKRGREMEAMMNRYKGFGKAGAGIGYGLARLFGAGSDEMLQAEREDAYAKEFLNSSSSRQQELITGATALAPTLSEKLRPYMERSQINEVMGGMNAKTMNDPQELMKASQALLEIPSGRDLGLKLFKASLERQKDLSGGGTDYINDVRFTTKNMGLNPDNPAHLLRGQEQYAANRGHGISKPAGEALIENLTEGRKTSKKLVESINSANRAMKLIDTGNLNMGSFANTRQGAARFFKYLGVTDSESPVLTDQFVAETANLVKDVLSSGDFGAGSGLSDADREYAAKLSGGDIKMEPAAAYRILQIRAKANQAKVRQYNAGVMGGEGQDSFYTEDFWRRSGLNKGAYPVEAPSVYQRPIARMDNWELQSIYGLPTTVTKDSLVKDETGNYYYSDGGAYINVETKEPYVAPEPTTPQVVPLKETIDTTDQIIDTTETEYTPF
jgi:hypothetical protein